MTEKKKTLLIIANVTNVHTHRFIREFKKRGWIVKIVSIQPPNSKNIEEFRDAVVQIPTYAIYRLLIKLPFFKYSEFHNVNSGVKWYEPHSISAVVSYMYLIVFIKKIVSQLNPTGIFSIYLTMNGFLAGLSGHKRAVNCIGGGDVTDEKIFSLKHWVNHPWIIRFAVSKSYKVISGTREYLKPLFKKINCKTDNIIWLGHWGVDTEKFHPSNSRKNNSDSFCRFICSRPYREKFDYEGILLALRKLYNHYKNFEFIIATGAQSKKNIEPLLKVIRKTGCTDFVKILNYIDYKDLPNQIKQCDIYIDPINTKKFPKTGEWGTSGSLLENMSCGLIPVISRRPSIDWILPPEAEKFIYDDFENGIVKALEKAIDSKNDKRIRMAMRNVIVEKANWNKNLDYIEKLLFNGN